MRTITEQTMSMNSSAPVLSHAGTTSTVSDLKHEWVKSTEARSKTSPATLDPQDAGMNNEAICRGVPISHCSLYCCYWQQHTPSASDKRFNTGQQILYVYWWLTTTSAVTFLRTSGSGFSPSKNPGFSVSSSAFELFIRMDTKWSDFSSSFSKPAKGGARVSTILGIARIMLTQEYLQPKTCCQLPSLSCTPNKALNSSLGSCFLLYPQILPWAPCLATPCCWCFLRGLICSLFLLKSCACALLHALRSSQLLSSSVHQYPTP